MNRFVTWATAGALLGATFVTPASAQTSYEPTSPDVSYFRPKKLDRLQFTPLFGWQFGGSASTYNGHVHIPAAPAYGAIFDFRVQPNTLLELAYSLQDTELRFEEPFVAGDRRLFGLLVQYFQIGAQFEPMPRGQLRPFIGVDFGMTLFSPQSTYSDELRFSASLLGGLKVMFSENVGIRGQARLAMTFLSTSTAIFCGTGGGCALGLGGGGIAQVDFSIGPTFAF